jgi:CheY-like chemotaxis protein
VPLATILVVDDEHGIRDFVKYQRRRSHCRTGLNAPPRPALARAMLRPDLVLLDIWMPTDGVIPLLKERL